MYGLITQLTTEPSDLTGVREALVEAGVEPEASEVRWQPKTTVTLDEDGAAKLLKLIDALEDNDDVQTVTANFSLSEALLAKMSAA